MPVSRLARLACALALLAACKKPEAEGQQKKKEPEQAAIKVRTIAIEEQEVPRFLIVTGSLKADRETENLERILGII